MRTLEQWRLERVLGVKELAKLAGVSHSTVIAIEHGRVAPKFRTIRRLAEALEVEPREVAEFAAALKQGDG